MVIAWSTSVVIDCLTEVIRPTSTFSLLFRAFHFIATTITDDQLCILINDMGSPDQDIETCTTLQQDELDVLEVSHANH